MAIPSEHTLLALLKLSEDPKNLVYIISGRDGEFLEQHLGHLSKVGFSAEHGGFMREPGQSKWMNFTEQLDMSWMSEVHEIFKYYTEVRTRALARVVANGQIENHWQSYRDQKELNHLALPRSGS